MSVEKHIEQFGKDISLEDSMRVLAKQLQDEQYRKKLENFADTIIELKTVTDEDREMYRTWRILNATLSPLSLIIGELAGVISTELAPHIHTLNELIVDIVEAAKS